MNQLKLYQQICVLVEPFIKLLDGAAQMKFLFSSFCPPQNASKLLRSDCLYREKRCFFPWASLFIWAVLQNRSEMALFFWEMVKTCFLFLHEKTKC